MASISRTGVMRKSLQAWLPARHIAVNSCQAPCHQIFIREIRTRAVFHKRSVPIANQADLGNISSVGSGVSQAREEAIRGDTTESKSTVGSFHEKTPLIKPQASVTCKTRQHLDSSKPESSTKESKGHGEMDTKTEKFPKKLQAFPFVPSATTSELSKAHKFFLLPAEFVRSASNLSMIPDNTVIPEVAFIGRSNIGKSSLINGLVNRNGLVKTSSKPIGDRLSLVDMPGYGWKSRDEWGEMILSYFQNRKNLKRIYILIDPSHGLKDSDTQIMNLLDKSGLSYQVVLTKKDKLSKTKYNTAKSQIESQLVKDAICCFPIVLGVSSQTKDGLNELRAAIIKAGQISFV
ncbi:hypothetical protein BGZ76_009893 [Entomortierella beljakovae]|nr:hypothetical protein BGZ76_009893 [Entomortierella beljakovae]